MKEFELMLAATLEGSLQDLRYPVLGSPKIDGFRATVRGGVLLSRNMKPIPNLELQKRYGRVELDGLDGELITGRPTNPSVFNESSRVVRAAGADASTTAFYVFDMWNIGGGFSDRYANTTARAGFYGAALNIHPVEHRLLGSPEEATDWETVWVGMGYEGMMTRDPSGHYKNGRSTMVEQGLVKVKRFSDSECVIEEVIQEQENTNLDEKDAFGRVKRSTKKAGMVPKATVGGFHVRGLNGRWKGVPFRCGTGTLTQEQCDALFKVRGLLPGRSFTFKWFPYGSMDAPRFPGFLKAEWLSDLVAL